MVKIRRTQERIWEERMGTLENVLKELSKESEELTLQRSDIGDYIQKTIINKKRIIFKYQPYIIAWLNCDDKTNDIVLKATNKKYLPLLNEICETYERKTLKEEPIIEY